MLPSLNLQSNADIELVHKIVAQVDKLNAYKQITHVLEPFIGTYDLQIQTKSKLTRVFEKIGNALFNYVMNRVRQLPILNTAPVREAFKQWTTNVQKHKVRFVWLLIEKQGLVTLLCKGPTFYQDMGQCMRDAWEFKPSVDYIEGQSFEILSYEVETPYEYVPTDSFTLKRRIRSPQNKIHQSSLIFNGVQYDYEMLGGCIVVKMPWKAQSTDRGYMDIFYVKKDDAWLYIDSDLQYQK